MNWLCRRVLKLSDRSEECLWVPPVVVATGNGCGHDLINVVLHGGMPSLHPWKMQMGEGESSGEWYIGHSGKGSHHKTVGFLFNRMVG